MDAVKYLKALSRICKTYSTCGKCPLRDIDGDCYKKIAHPEEMVAIVEKWSEEHPVKTRQSELLKMFPNIPKHFGYVDICPRELGVKEKVVCDGDCCRCKREFWLAEVD